MFFVLIYRQSDQVIIPSTEILTQNTNQVHNNFYFVLCVCVCVCFNGSLTYKNCGTKWSALGAAL